MRSKTHPATSVWVIVIFWGMAIGAAGQSLSVSSSSSIVGESVNYTYSFSGATSPTQVQMSFSDWSSNNARPYQSTTMCYQFNTPITPVFLPPSTVVCNLAVSSSDPVLTLTNMLNPSSTLPYSLTAVLQQSGGSVTLSASLTATTPQNYNIIASNLNTTLGSTSSVSLTLTNPTYLTSTTVLSLTHDINLVTMTIPSTSSYTATDHGNGTTTITSWVSPVEGIVTLTGITVVNPSAALTYSLAGQFYLVSNSTNYQICTGSLSVTLASLSYTTLSMTTPLGYGDVTTLVISATCGSSQVSSNTTTAYSTLTYTSSHLSPLSSSNCTANGTTACNFDSFGATTHYLSDMQVGVGTFTSTSVTLTAYTYHYNAFYPLCSGTVTLTLTTQTITPFIESSQCDSSTVEGSNVISLFIPTYSPSAGDTVLITGMTGTITDTTTWATTTISGITYQIHTLTSSQITAHTSTQSLVSLPLTYTNPTSTTTNSLTALLQRSSSTYASSTTATSLCTVDTPATISSYSQLHSVDTTYSTNLLTIQTQMTMTDYVASDYLTISFAASDNNYLFPLSSTLLGLTPSATVSGVAATTVLNNSTQLRITIPTGATLPSQSDSTLSIVISNIVNPPMVSSYWLTLLTYSHLTSASKQSLTTTPASPTASALTSSLPDLSLLQNNSLTLTLTNANRQILRADSATSSSSLSISLPSVLTCSNANNSSLSIAWNVAVTTTTSPASGNTTALSVDFGTCYVDYFNGSIDVTVTETYQGAASTSTTISVSNVCGSDCYQCSGGTCTACFNSTHTTSTVLYLGVCYSSCPDGSYSSASDSCLTCHASCSTCTGASYLDCSTCATNFATNGSYCVSVCGTGQYLSGSCQSCHANCQACLSDTVCYLCKTNATLINSECTFTSCTSPCATCLSTQSTCTSCSDPYNLYQSQCLEDCPSGYYPLDNQCKEVTESPTYLPVTIVGVLVVLGVLALRAYSSKKIGNESRRSLAYTQNTEPLMVNYKINVLRVCAVLFTYLEITAAAVVVAKNEQFQIGENMSLMLMIAFACHIICNLLFLIWSIRECCRKEAKDEEEGGKVREGVVTILSVLFTFRSVKLLFANLFLDRNRPARRKNSIEGLRNTAIDHAPSLGPGQPSKGPSEGQRKRIMRSDMIGMGGVSLEQKIPSRKPIRANSLADEPLRINDTQNSLPLYEQARGEWLGRLSHPLVTYLTIASLVTASLLTLVAGAVEVWQSEFINMFFWGLDCLLVTVCAIILNSWDLWVFVNLTNEEQHSEMSSRPEDPPEMPNPIEQEVNQTHQNLREIIEHSHNEEEIVRPTPVKEAVSPEKVVILEVKHQPQPSQSSSPSSPKQVRKVRTIPVSRASLKPIQQRQEPKSGKEESSSLEKKAQTRRVSKSKSREKQINSYRAKSTVRQGKESKPEVPPVLKVFDDLDDDEQGKQEVMWKSKSKKFSTKSLNNKHTKRSFQSKGAPPQVPLPQKQAQVGELCGDIYLNFDSEEPTDGLDTRPVPSLGDTQLIVRGASTGLLAEQPPNFADISDIADASLPEVSSEGGNDRLVGEKREEE